MCGIYVGLGAIGETKDRRKLIRNRGPDFVKNLELSIKGHNIQLTSSVLHVRGQTICQQPVENDSSVLQWNGEVFAGLEVYYIFYLCLK